MDANRVGMKGNFRPANRFQLSLENDFQALPGRLNRICNEGSWLGPRGEAPITLIGSVCEGFLRKRKLGILGGSNQL